MSTNKSQNLKLHLWEPKDNFLRTEFNENFAAIDAAMKEEQSVRAAAVSAEAQTRAQAVQELQNSIHSTGSSASAALEQAKQELSDAVTQAQATADAAWSESNRPYVMKAVTITRGTAQSVYLGFAPSFVLLFGERTGAVLWGVGNSSCDDVAATAWTSTGFSFRVASGNSGSDWGSSGGFIAWR